MRQATVFVVDDEEQICTLLTRILARDGLRTLAFAAPAPALAAVEAESPDLIVTDLTMPGMTGLELAAQAKLLRPGTSVVVMTGYASLENVVEALRSGIDDFVTKPFSVSEIREVVQRVLARRTASAEALAAAAAAGGQRPASDQDTGDRLLTHGLRDAAVVEAVHALLSAETDVEDLADRVVAELGVVLGFDRALLVLPQTAPPALRVASASRSLEGVRPGARIDVPELQAILSTGASHSQTISDGAAAEIARALRVAEPFGPAAAAPLRPRDPSAAGAGLLVAVRAAGAPAFLPVEIPLLGMAAAGLGQLVAAACAAETTAAEYRASLCDVVAASERRSTWFRDHSTRVRDLAVRLGERLGLAKTDLDVIEAAAPLLDLGRIVLGDDVLAKEGRLSPDDWRALREHPGAADAIVRPLGVLRQAKPVIRHHHENWDGSGYPDGLRGDDIPYLASLVRIADSFAALTSPRPWRAALPADEALRRIVESSGTQFHPQLVAAFTEMQTGGPGA